MTTTTTNSDSWLPMPGRYSVSLGTSLTRALKVRQGGTTAKSSKLPGKDFHSFRYNFKPPSVDPTKPGVVEIKKGTDITRVTVERGNTHTNEGPHVFIGKEEPAKEVECVLIMNEDEQTFTLEKLDSIVTLTHDRKVSRGARLSPPGSSSRPSAASTPAHPPLPSNRDRKARVSNDITGDIDEELIATLEPDAEGELEEETVPVPTAAVRQTNAKGKAPARPKATAKVANPSRNPASISRQSRHEEEESEGEKPLAQTASVARPAASRNKPPITAVQATKTAQSTKTTNRPSVPAKAQAAPAADKEKRVTTKYKSKSVAGTKRERPSKQEQDHSQASPKRARISPGPSLPAPQPSKKASPPPESDTFNLVLPGNGAAESVLPPAPAKTAAPEPEPPVQAEVDSDEEDWYAVPVVPVEQPPQNEHSPPLRKIEMEEIVPTSSRVEEEEEYSDDALVLDLEEQLFEDNKEDFEDNEEDDFLAKELAAPPTDSQPLNEEDNIWGEGDEDDYSSSDDSDDDDD